MLERPAAITTGSVGIFVAAAPMFRSEARDPLKTVITLGDMERRGMRGSRVGAASGTVGYGYRG